jgi:hypothetical protein
MVRLKRRLTQATKACLLATFIATALWIRDAISGWLLMGILCLPVFFLLICAVVLPNPNRGGRSKSPTDHFDDDWTRPDEDRRRRDDTDPMVLGSSAWFLDHFRSHDDR